MTQPTSPSASTASPTREGFEEQGGAVARNWGWMLARGLLGIGFGVMALLFPLATLGALVLLFAVYAFADGFAAIVAAVRAMRRDRSWGWLLLHGIVSLGAAAAALLMPLVAIRVFLFIIAFWAMFGGIAMIVAAVRMPADHGRWSLAIGGLLSLVWGVLLILQPAIGAVLLAIWFGAYTLAVGVMFTLVAVTLRRRHTERLASA